MALINENLHRHLAAFPLQLVGTIRSEPMVSPYWTRTSLVKSLFVPVAGVSLSHNRRLWTNYHQKKQVPLLKRHETRTRHGSALEPGS